MWRMLPERLNPNCLDLKVPGWREVALLKDSHPPSLFHGAVPSDRQNGWSVCR